MSVRSFLCRDEAERARLVDVARRLRPGLPVIFGLFGLAGLAGVGAYGWRTLVGPALATIVFGAAWLRRPSRRHRPEYAYAIAFVVGELLLCAAPLVSPRSLSYGYVALIMPVLPVAAVFPRRVVIAATAFATTLMVAMLLVVDLAAVRAMPPLAWCAPLVLISLGATVLVARDLDETTRRSALVDGLTGTLNRSALGPRLSELTHQVRSSGEPVAVVVADLDGFKGINDEHGHAAGDEVLREVGQRLRECIGGFDPVYRIGGEEFVILLPGRDADAAERIAARMREAIRETAVGDLRLTMSFGVAASVAGEPFDFDEVFREADFALYTAKRTGRDRVCVAPGPGEPVAPVPQRRGERTRRATSDRLDVGSGGPRRVRHASGPARADHMSEQLELEHVLALSRQVTPTFICLMAGAFTGVAAASPWFGWHTLIAPVLAGIPAGIIAATADRFRRPERALALNWLLFQTSIAVGFLSARGAPLFALTLLALMVPGNCTMLPPRVSIPSIVYSALMLGLVAVDLAGTSAILHNPSIVLFPMALIIEAGYIGVVICRSAMGFRGASVIDPLTGLLNRAALRARLDELEVQAPSVGRPVAILLADLDHFKDINDRVGHAVGDAVLRETASRILGCLRTFESAYRVGGEEFLVLLPAADASAARAVAERIWHAVRERPCAGVRVTISVGVAVAEPGAPFAYEGIFRRADAALYEAKRQGRDQVCVDEPDHALVGDVAVSEAA